MSLTLLLMAAFWHSGGESPIRLGDPIFQSSVAQEACPPEEIPQTLDIVGIKLTDSAAEAVGRLNCLGYQVSFGFANLPSMPGDEPPIGRIFGRKHNELVVVLLAGGHGVQGLPLEVVGVRRRVDFGAGEEPAIDALQTDLQLKYPTLELRFEATYPRHGSRAHFLAAFEGGSGVLRPFDWCHDEHAFHNELVSYPDARCDVFFAADLVTRDQNRGLVKSFAVQVSNGQRAEQLNARWRAATSVAAEEARRREVEEARRRRPPL